MKVAQLATRFRQFGRKLANSVLTPIARNAPDSMATRLTEQIEQVAFRFNRASNRLASDIVAQCKQCIASGHAENLRRLQPQLRKEIAELRTTIASQMPENPCIHGFKVFAQTDEDGIIGSILERLPGHSNTFIEIGCGNGLENNTHYLALQDYRGVWIDGSDDNIMFIKDVLGGLEFEKLLIISRFVSTENVGALLDKLCAFVRTTEVGFFSLDIDGNDYYVLAEALNHIRPLTICVEYNAKFPPPLKMVMRYDPSHRWAGDDYHGASLQSFCDLLVDYKLVSCNLAGVNAFFVRRDQAGAFDDYSPAQLYQPFRENLIDLWAEHTPSLKWLKDSLGV